MKIATELHRPTWVSLPLVDAILRDDVLILFITPPEFQTEPKLTVSSEFSYYDSPHLTASDIKLRCVATRDIHGYDLSSPITKR